MNGSTVKKQNYSDESGIAVIIALIMLLVMSIMAISVSFLSNTDFQSMANFKRGQEAFLAAESCVQATRRQIAEEGIAALLFKQSVATLDPVNIDISDDNTNVITDSSGIGAICRSGSRIMDGTTVSSIDPIFTIPDDVKTIERPVRDTNLPDAGSGGAIVIPVTFTVMGKDAQDSDKGDSDLELNTGTQIAVGIETFGGGASNVY